MKQDKKECLHVLKLVFGNEKPLARLLGTSNSRFLYDTGTNKLLGCRQEVFELLHGLMTKGVDRAVSDFVAGHGEKELLASAGEIIDAVESENVLITKKATRFGLSDHYKNVDELLRHSVKSVNLEVTQECNLRCEYCIYHDHYKEKRNYSTGKMSMETARKAVDFLKNHSGACQEVLIGFYGGEPMMRPGFVRDCVQYTGSVFREKPVLYNITTNATLIDENSAGFLVDNNFSVLVNLDGPEVYHDMYRKDTKGQGSFARTLNGLRLLAEASRKKKKGTISVNVVYTPPFSREKLEDVTGFFKQLDWLSGVQVFTEYPGHQSFPEGMVPPGDMDEDIDLMQWSFEKYAEGFQNADSMVKRQVEKRLASFLQRPVLTRPLDAYPLNGCCVPGLRKNYVAVDGRILLCEKAPSQTPAVGHVDTGLDVETIKKIYIEDYARQSMEYCSRCWGIRLCGLCYVQAFDGQGKFDRQKKLRACYSNLVNLERSLGYFAELLATQPEKLEYLNGFEIT